MRPTPELRDPILANVPAPRCPHCRGELAPFVGRFADCLTGAFLWWGCDECGACSAPATLPRAMLPAEWASGLPAAPSTRRR